MNSICFMSKTVASIVFASSVLRWKMNSAFPSLSPKCLKRRQLADTDGQLDFEARAPVKAVFDSNAPAGCFDDRARDGQSEAAMSGQPTLVWNTGCRRRMRSSGEAWLKDQHVDIDIGILASCRTGFSTVPSSGNEGKEEDGKEKRFNTGSRIHSSPRYTIIRHATIEL